MLHQGNFPGKKPSSGQRRVHKGQQRHSQGVFLLLVPCGHNSSDCTQCGNLVAQGTMAHLNWLRSQSAPLVPKNSKERGLSEDPECGSAPVLGCPGQGGGTALPSAIQCHHLIQHLGAPAGVSPVQRPPSTSSHLLGKGLESPSPPGLDISPLRHSVSGVTQTHSNP